MTPSQGCSCAKPARVPLVPQLNTLDATDLLVGASPGFVIAVIPAAVDAPQARRNPLLELSAGARSLRERNCILRI